MIALLLAVAPLAAGAPAAEIPVPEVDVQRYRVPVDASSTLWADDASVTTGPSARLAVGFLKEPFVWIWADTGERVPVVDDVLGVEAIASFAAWRIRGAVDVPLYPLATGALGSGGGLGDIAVDVKGSLLDGADAPLGLALGARITLPTATTALPLGGGGVGWEVSAIVDERVGPVLLAANVGTRGVPDGGGVGGDPRLGPAVSDAFVYRAGVGLAPGDRAGVSLDVAGQIAYADLADPSGRSLEAMLGGWVRLAPPLTLRGGVGRGLLGGIGSPTARAVVAVSWQPPPKKEVVVERRVSRDEKARSEFLIADSGRSAVAPGIVHIAVTGPDGKHVPATWAFGNVARTDIPLGVGSAKASPGPWLILVSAPGFGTQGVSVDVETGVTLTLSVQLKPAKVVVTGDHIELLEKLRWNGATLDPASEPVLDELAATLRAHPEIRGARVEGHTDSRGDDAENLTLSGERAFAVVSAMTERGLDPALLVAVGRGEAFPRDRSDTPEAWAKNERIEIVVTERKP